MNIFFVVQIAMTGATFLSLYMSWKLRKARKNLEQQSKELDRQTDIMRKWNAMLKPNCCFCAAGDAVLQCCPACYAILHQMQRNKEEVKEKSKQKFRSIDEE